MPCRRSSLLLHGIMSDKVTLEELLQRWPRFSREAGPIQRCWSETSSEGRYVLGDESDGTACGVSLKVVPGGMLPVGWRCVFPPALEICRQAALLAL